MVFFRILEIKGKTNGKKCDSPYHKV